MPHMAPQTNAASPAPAPAAVQKPVGPGAGPAKWLKGKLTGQPMADQKALLRPDSGVLAPPSRPAPAPPTSRAPAPPAHPAPPPPDRMAPPVPNRPAPLPPSRPAPAALVGGGGPRIPKAPDYPAPAAPGAARAVAPRPKVPAAMTDADVAQWKGGADERSINDVRQVKYDKPIGSSGQSSGFFKANGQVPMAGNSMGIENSDGRMASRAVASSRLDRALGTNVLAEEVFAQHDGQVGSVSAMAQGVKPTAMTTNLFEQLAVGETAASAAGNNSKKVGADGKVYGLTGARYNITEDQLRNPETQKGMSNLGVMDFLTQQADRHMGNIFTDPVTGKVTGIDNDVAFGQENERGWSEKGQKFWNREKNARGQEKGGKLVGFELGHLPQQVDAGTGASLLAMTEADFVKSIAGEEGDLQKLNEAEIAAAKERFHVLQDHVAKLQADGKLIETWNDDTFAAPKAEAARPDAGNGDMTSYTARYLAAANYAATSKNSEAPGASPQSVADRKERHRMNNLGAETSHAMKADVAKKQEAADAKKHSGIGGKFRKLLGR